MIYETLRRAFRAAGEHRRIRRYLYAIGEVAGVALTSFASSVVFMDRGYRTSHGDPGMAKVTGICMLVIGAGFFALSYCAKAMDNKVVDLIARVVKLESHASND